MLYGRTNSNVLWFNWSFNKWHYSISDLLVFYLAYFWFSSLFMSVFFVVVSSFSLNVILGLWFYFPPFADGIFLSVALAYFFKSIWKPKWFCFFLSIIYISLFMFLFILLLEHPVHSQIKVEVMDILILLLTQTENIQYFIMKNSIFSILFFFLG